MNQLGALSISVALISLAASTISSCCCSGDPECRVRRDPVTGQRLDAHYWGFEDGLEGWTANGSAFESQPMTNPLVSTRRALPSAYLSTLAAVGGDYWDVPWEIGVVDEGWVSSLDGPQGASATGTLNSPVFTLGRNNINFLLGGTCADESVGLRVEAGTSSTGFAVLDTADVDCATGMRRGVFRLNEHVGRSVRLVLFDASDQGHVTLDDVFTSDGTASDQPRPVWGLADTHAHPASHLGFGETLFWNDPEEVPSTCTGTDHGNNGSNAGAFFISVLEGSNDLLAPVFNCTSYYNHPARTPQTYTRWQNTTHQSMRMDWIRRAYEGGLRLMVAEAVNNRLLDTIGHNPPRIPLTDTAVYLRQIDYVRNLIARNDDWMELALTPADARRIIESNKLAIVLGIEVDSFGDCDLEEAEWRSTPNLAYRAPTRRCTREQIEQSIDEIYRRGVRQLHPVHVADNQFGASGLYVEQFNMNNIFLNGRYFDVHNTPDVAYQQKLLLSVVSDSCGPRPNFQVDSPHTGTINARGLTDDGAYLIGRLQRRGMMVAVDHMSERTLDAVMGLRGHEGLLDTAQCDELPELGNDCLKAAGIPVTLSHTALRPLSHPQYTNEVQKRRDQIERVMLVGGVVAPGLNPSPVLPPETTGAPPAPVNPSCEDSSRQYAQQLAVLEHWWSEIGEDPRDLGVPLGTDANGLVKLVGPRYGTPACDRDNAQRGLQIDSNGLKYAHYESNGTFTRTVPCENTNQTCSLRFDAGAAPLIADQSLGKTWDFNDEGMAHYGMLPDFMQDLATIGLPPEQRRMMFRGAEAYIRSWERACGRSDASLSQLGCGPR